METVWKCKTHCSSESWETVKHRSHTRVKNNQRRWATRCKSQWKRGHVGWRGGGAEKREEGEVFTLRVLIHYRKAEARSVTLSRWCHLYTTRKVTQHFAAPLQTRAHTHTHARMHTRSICAFTKTQTDTLPSVALSPRSRCCSRTDTNKHGYAYI